MKFDHQDAEHDNDDSFIGRPVNSVSRRCMQGHPFFLDRLRCQVESRYASNSGLESDVLVIRYDVPPFGRTMREAMLVSALERAIITGRVSWPVMFDPFSGNSYRNNGPVVRPNARIDLNWHRSELTKSEVQARAYVFAVVKLSPRRTISMIFSSLRSLWPAQWGAAPSFNRVRPWHREALAANCAKSLAEDK